jgi:hypothetical protein
MTNDKRYLVPIFKTGNKKPGGSLEVTPKSKPILMEEFKMNLGSKLISKSKLGEEVTDDEGLTGDYDDLE